MDCTAEICHQTRAPSRSRDGGSSRPLSSAMSCWSSCFASSPSRPFSPTSQMAWRLTRWPSAARY